MSEELHKVQLNPALAAAEPELDQEGPVDPDSLQVDLHSWLLGSTDIAEALAKARPSRELALVKTKLEEAEMWLLKMFQLQQPEVTQ